MKKIRLANIVLENRDLYKDNEVSEANETIKKYGETHDIIQLLSKYRHETLRPRAVNESRLSKLEQIAKNL